MADIDILIDTEQISIDILGANGPSIWDNLTGTANHIPFNLEPVDLPTANGTLYWDAGAESMAYTVDGGSIQVGKEVFDYYTNLSGVTMVDGDVVSVVSASGGRSAVTLTDSTDFVSTKALIGMVTEGGTNNNKVRVTKIGTVNNLNTDGMIEGSLIYIDPTLPGKWTQIEPTYPNVAATIGIVKVAHAVNGIVDVNPISDGYASQAQGALADTAIQPAGLPTALALNPTGNADALGLGAASDAVFGSVGVGSGSGKFKLIDGGLFYEGTGINNTFTSNAFGDAWSTLASIVTTRNVRAGWFNCWGSGAAGGVYQCGSQSGVAWGSSQFASDRQIGIFRFDAETVEVQGITSSERRDLLARNLTASGTVTGSNLSGTNTGDETAESVAALIAEDPTAARDAMTVSRRSKYLHGPDSAISSLKSTLDAGMDCAFGVITDSTGNATDEWVYLTAAAIGSTYPDHRIIYRLFNDTTHLYEKTVIQNGTGGDRHINFPAGSTFGYTYLVDNALGTLTGYDLEIQAEISLDAGGYPSTSCVLLDWGSSDFGRGWLQLGTTGFVQLNWSEDASGATTKTTNTTTVMPPLTAGVKYRFKATLDIDNGSGSRVVEFWYSTDSGSLWTQIGTTVTTSGVTTVYNPTGNIYIINSRGSAPTPGVKFYDVQAYRGIGGDPLLPTRIDQWNRNTSVAGNVASLSGAPVLYIDNNAQSGWLLTTHIGQTFPARAYVDRGRLFWIVASSHNDVSKQVKQFGDDLDTLTAIMDNYELTPTPIVIANQNPEDETNSAAVWAADHNRRCVGMSHVAAARNHAFIDVWRAWQDYGDWIPLLNPADGKHPIAAGSQLTADTIVSVIGI